MRKELEYAKKITLIAKLYRMNLLSEKEFEKIRRKLMDSYLVSGTTHKNSSFVCTLLILLTII